MHNRNTMSRRYFLQVTGSGAVVATALGSSGLWPRTAGAADTFTWISPRGTLEVLDDYPYWVGKAMGYFGDLDTRMEPGPSDGTATVKFVALGCYALARAEGEIEYVDCTHVPH